MKRDGTQHRIKINAHCRIPIDKTGYALAYLTEWWCEYYRNVVKENRNEQINIQFLSLRCSICCEAQRHTAYTDTRIAIYLMLMLLPYCLIPPFFSTSNLFSSFLLRQLLCALRSATVNNGLAHNIFEDDAKPQNEWQPANQHRIRFYFNLFL